MSLAYFTATPDWEHGRRDEKGFLRSVAGKPIWSNEKAPPAIGARVRVCVNRIGMATVKGYFIIDGFLGVKLEIDEWPDGLKGQNGADLTCHAFGAEVELE